MRCGGVTVGIETVNSGRSNIFDFLYEITQRKCGATGNVAVSWGGVLYSVDILSCISKDPYTAVTHSFEGTAEHFKCPLHLYPGGGGEKNCPG